MKRQLLFETTSTSLSEFQKTTETISKLIPQKSVIALSGPMGAGKTEFVKTLCRLRGIQNANSPTFALHHHYQNENVSVEHLDLFRLESEDEIEATGFWDLFSQDSGLILIEWPEKMNLEQIPQNWPLFFLEIDLLDFERRKISFSKRI